MTIQPTENTFLDGNMRTWIESNIVWINYPIKEVSIEIYTRYFQRQLITVLCLILQIS